MNCDEYRRLIVQEGELDAPENDALAEHLSCCALCTALLDKDADAATMLILSHARSLITGAPDQGLQAEVRRVLGRLIADVASEVALGLSPTFAAVRSGGVGVRAQDEMELGQLLQSGDWDQAIGLLEEVEDRLRVESIRTLDDLHNYVALCHVGREDWERAATFLKTTRGRRELRGLWPDLLDGLTQILRGDLRRGRELLAPAAGEYRELIAPVMRLL